MAKKETYVDVSRIPGYGLPIKDSCLFRGFCPRCLAPVRLTAAKIHNKSSVFCEDCSPRHIGVGNGLSVVNDVDHDPDAFCPNWKQS